MHMEIIRGARQKNPFNIGLLFSTVNTSKIGITRVTSVAPWEHSLGGGGGAKAQIVRRRHNFSDKTNSSEPPYNVLFLKVS